MTRDSRWFPATFAGLLLLFVASSGAPAAQELTWVWTGGPEGAHVTSFLATPRGTLLAGTENGGLFRSTDGGESWSSEAPGLTWPCCNYGVPSLAASATALYAGTWGGGVYRSDDDGESWYPTGAIPDEGYPLILGLATCFHGERVYASGQFGVVRSDDGGATWTAADDGLPAAWVWGLALRGTVLYARLEQNVYRLDPESQTWSAWEEGLPSTLGMQSIRASGSGLYLSTHDGGVHVLDCDDETWVPFNTGLYDDNVDCTVEAGSSIYAGLMGGGAYRYDWAGGSWSAVNDGLWNWDIRTMAAVGAVPYAGTFGAGVFRYDPGSESWAASTTGMTAPLLNSLVTDGTHVFAGGHGCGVHVSHDEGGSWQAAVNGLGDHSVFALVQHGGDLFAGTWIGVWKSGDLAQSWSSAGLTSEGIFALSSAGATLYAGTFWGEVFSSSNGGETWDAVGSGLPTGTVRNIVRLGPTLYAALDGQGVFRLEEEETEWVAINTGLPELAIGALAESGGDLFVGHPSSGVYRWSEGTQAWEATGLTSTQIFTLADTPDGLMAGARGQLFVSADAGESWTLEYEGLREWLSVRAIAVGDDEYFTALECGGVWRAPRESGAVDAPDLGGDTGPGGDGGAAGRAAAGVGPHALTVEPNPFHDGARIAFRLERPARVELAVFDAAGRSVASLVSAVLPAGAQAVRWDGTRGDGARVSAGVFFVRLRVGDEAWTVREVRVR